MFTDLILFFIIWYALCCITILFLENRYTFIPPRPASYEDKGDIIYLDKPNGERLAAVYRDNPKAIYTVLICHGNAEDLGNLFDKINEFVADGYSVMAFDYQGYGLSSGTPSLSELESDVAVAADFLKKRGIPSNRIILFGRSLGTGPAIYQASKDDYALLFLQSPYISIYRVITVIKVFPWDRFNNLDRIGAVTAPILIVHGTADTVIPFWHSKKLQENIMSPHSIIEMPGHGHNGLPTLLDEEVAPKFNALLNAAKTL